MTKQTLNTSTATPADPLELPASLRRAKTPVVEVKSDAAATPATTEEPKAKSENLVQAAKRITKAAKAITSKEKPASKKAKDNTAAIAKAAKPKKTDLKPHQPSTIKPTDQNPAKSIVPVSFKKQYAAHNDTCGRPINMALKEYTTTTNEDGRDALDLVKLQEVAMANGFDAAKLYGHLNRGQQRMNVGNRLAGLVKQGKTVIIGKRKFANADKALAAPTAQQATAAA